MFRFFNTGLKQSVTTFPSYAYHAPLRQRLWENDENENDINKSVLAINDKISPVYLNPKRTLTACLSKMRTFEGCITQELTNIFWLMGIPNLQFSEVVIDTKHIPLDRFIENINITESTESNVDNKEENKILEVTAESANSTQRDHLSDLRIFEHKMNEKGCNAAEKSDWDNAVRYWNCASSMNYPPAQFNLGVYHESRNDMALAEKWYRAAVNNGDHPTAAYNLAILLNNKNNDLLREEILSLLYKSANQGLSEALDCISRIDKI